MPIKIFIHAVNVHQGGGRKLLEGLLGALDSDDHEYVLNLDERMPLSLKERSNVSVRRVRPSIIQRLTAEVWLFRNARRGDRVLCFGNLPPLFRLQAFTSVFLQNRYLIDRVGLSGFTVWARLRITVERLWLRYAQLHANEYLVQTPTMQHLTNELCQGRVPVTVLPFAVGQVSAKPAGDGGSTSATGFVYVASGEPHKNHRQLIEAWRILAEENIYPKLVLTVDKNAFPELCHWIEEKKKAHNLFVENLGSVNSVAMADIYAKTQALIYPSTFESLGLPLIEAEQAGMPILASELDYVRDVVSPVQTFNPGSAISIAKAVKRFLGASEVAMPVGSPGTFMHHILSRLN
jgi:glycosyltransferase involved in cell wall biosynthesis